MARSTFILSPLLGGYRSAKLPLYIVYRDVVYNTGDGLRMAEALGARLDWMDDFHGRLIPYVYKKHTETGKDRHACSIS